MPRSISIRKARPAYSQAALLSSPRAKSELVMTSKAWIVVTSLRSSSQELADSLAIPPSSRADIARVFADLEPGAKLGCSEVDGVEEKLGEIWTVAGHVTHEGGSVGDEERVMLAIPVKREQVHAQIRINAVKVELTLAKIELLHLACYDLVLDTT